MDVSGGRSPVESWAFHVLAALTGITLAGIVAVGVLDAGLPRTIADRSHGGGGTSAG